MEGNRRENITFTQNVKKRGYETVIPLKFNGSYLVAKALAADGTVLATTDVWDLALGATVSNIKQITLPFHILPLEMIFTSHLLFCSRTSKGIKANANIFLLKSTKLEL